MKKANLSYEQHLVISEHAVSPGAEWVPQASGWTVIQVRRGAGYWLQSQSTMEIESGTVLVVAAGVPGRIRASQLNGLALFSFRVFPGRLTGLVTFGEREFLDQMAMRSARVFPPSNPISQKLETLRGADDGTGLFFRLELLKLFLETLGNEWEPVKNCRESADARERLRAFLAEAPPETLLGTSFRELARMIRCTPRHLSRAFNESVGMSFRDKRAEIQLTRAQELLANSDSKIVDVALESGYRSLSLFNMMFARRFGTSPGRWRQQNAINKETKTSGYFRFRENGVAPAIQSELMGCR